ncbi:MAG TPA: DUF2726 domain-containing protein [Candidatus Acidoferrales bacterium]|nr:DUF2726 domain-containing protein [Candidatus Acidoferrales bacterium]
MHTNRILCWDEPKVDVILQRQLAKEGYRILPKVRVADAINKDASDHLSSRDFEYFTRAHFDFLVTKNLIPILAVEFDGSRHFQDEQAIENDTIKNRLCKDSALPLLRITSSELHDSDQLTLLDYMLMRYVSWQKEYPSIMEEINEFAANIGPDYDPDNLAVDFDPSFRFDLRHPFPARDTVVERLWRNHKIAWSMAKPERHRSATCLCDVTIRSAGPSENDQFHKCSSRALAWEQGQRERPRFSEDVSVSLRCWLPLRPHVPTPDIFPVLRGELSGSDADKRAEEIFNQFKIRVESIWFPDLPGLSTWGIADNYAEYMGFRAVEKWAKSLRDNDVGTWRK